MRNRASMALEIEKRHQFLVTALFREAHCRRGRRCSETSANSTKRIVALMLRSCGGTLSSARSLLLCDLGSSTDARSPGSRDEAKVRERVSRGHALSVA
jgi:hypothetical protein